MSKKTYEGVNENYTLLADINSMWKIGAFDRISNKLIEKLKLKTEEGYNFYGTANLLNACRLEVVEQSNCFRTYSKSYEFRYINATNTVCKVAVVENDGGKFSIVGVKNGK